MSKDPDSDRAFGRRRFLQGAVLGAAVPGADALASTETAGATRSTKRSRESPRPGIPTDSGGRTPAPASGVPMYDVRSYGAKGDGVADDTGAIQAAIDAAQNGGGGTVFLPPGTYRVTSTLEITKEGTALVGSESLGVNTGVIIRPDDLSFDVIHVNGVNFATVILNLQIKPLAGAAGGSGGANGPRAIFLDQVQEVRIENVAISGTYNGVYVTGGAILMRNVGFTPADVSDTGRYGFKVTGVTGNANLCQMYDCSVGLFNFNHPRTTDGFVLAAGYNTLILINCGCLGANRALWSTDDGGGPPNFLQTYNFTSDHSNIGIVLDDGAYSLFSGALVTSSYVASVIVSSTYEDGPVQFIGCNITNTTGGFTIAGPNRLRPVYVASTQIAAIGASTGGAGYRTAGDGIEVSGPGEVLVSDCEIDNVAGSALHLDPGFSGVFSATGIVQHNATHGLLIEEGVSGRYTINGCSFDANSVQPYSVASSPAPLGSRIAGSYGINPVGALDAPPLPASGKALQNPFPFDCTVYVSGGAVSSSDVGDRETGMRSGAIRLPAGESITLHYRSPPTWRWFGD